MVQPYLIGDDYQVKPVNVASVPQRSPFRYPGGKTWLTPHLRRWLLSLPERPARFCEPFAGGAISSLTVAFENLADHVVMVELDHQVAAVWHTILHDDGGADWLAKQILSFELTRESLDAALAIPARQTRGRAFQTILKNRVYHGGILAPGSAPVKRGENGKGITSRWYPTTLARRILEIAKYKGKIEFHEGDGLAFLNLWAESETSAWFIDPPYTASKKKAGSRLYTHSTLDHERLFDLAENLAGPFLMTYDDDLEIVGLAERHNLKTDRVAMNNTHNATMNELLIGRNLDWLKPR